MLTRKKIVAAAMGAAATGAAVLGISISSASPGTTAAASAAATTTPIKHVVVIYDENISFDHYFGTYPNATNPPNEPQFQARKNTPTVNGLSTALLTANPNTNDPERLDPSQAVTCDQNHGYSAEESAFDSGLMDNFVQDTTGGGCTETNYPDNNSYGPNGIVMDYFDGNTVTGLWNYAQHFTLNDNSYSTQFGPSTPGAINLISGNTFGVAAHNASSSSAIAPAGSPSGTDIGDADPYYDLCSDSSTSAADANGNSGGATIAMTGQNVGDLLNKKSIPWGWFEGGFAPTTPTSTQKSGVACGSAHANIANASTADYVPHHEPFQYYQDTANPDHVSPASTSDVGVSDPAGTPASKAVNHQYDLTEFNKTLTSDDSDVSMPAVSYLKAPAYEDGHAGYSDPLDEQRFLVDEINMIEQSKYWPSTAVVIAYDDSDGWYDHQMGSIIRPSEDAADQLNGPGKCGSSATPPAQNGRCGVGPRQPLLVISPWAKQNYVDNTFTEQASILRFIEDNWNLGRIGNQSADASSGSLDSAFDFNQRYGHAPAIILNDTTGEISKVIQPDGQVSSGGSGAGAGSGSGSGSSSGSGSGYGSDSGSGQGHGVTGTGDSSTGTKGNGKGSGGDITLPALNCRPRVAKHTITLACTTKGGSKVPVLIRIRLYRGRSLVSNEASRVRSHRVRFSMRLGKHAAAAYKLRMTIDAGGAVGALTRYVRVR